MHDVEQRVKLEEHYERIADFMSRLATKSIDERSNREDGFRSSPNLQRLKLEPTNRTSLTAQVAEQKTYSAQRRVSDAPRQHAHAARLFSDDKLFSEDADTRWEFFLLERLNR